MDTVEHSPSSQVQSIFCIVVMQKRRKRSFSWPFRKSFPTEFLPINSSLIGSFGAFSPCNLWPLLALNLDQSFLIDPIWIFKPKNIGIVRYISTYCFFRNILQGLQARAKQSYYIKSIFLLHNPGFFWSNFHQDGYIW